MSYCVKIETGEDGLTQAQEQDERIASLKEANRLLQEELVRLQNWPDEATEREYNSVSAWRNRAVIAERKLEVAYARLRTQDSEIIKLTMDLEEMQCSKASAN